MKRPSSLAGVSPYRHSARARYEDNFFIKNAKLIVNITAGIICALIIAIAFNLSALMQTPAEETELVCFADDSLAGWSHCERQ